MNYINFNLIDEPYLMDHSSYEMKIDNVAIQCGHVVNFVNINIPKEENITEVEEEIEVSTTEVKETILKRNIRNTVLIR